MKFSNYVLLTKQVHSKCPMLHLLTNCCNQRIFNLWFVFDHFTYSSLTICSQVNKGILALFPYYYPLPPSGISFNLANCYYLNLCMLYLNSSNPSNLFTLRSLIPHTLHICSSPASTITFDTLISSGAPN